MTAEAPPLHVTAHHEAGHAVVAYALGLSVEYATITQTEHPNGGVINGHVRSTHPKIDPGMIRDKLTTQAWASLSVFAAGHAAERVWCGCAEPKILLSGDRMDAVRVLHVLCPPPKLPPIADCDAADFAAAIEHSKRYDQIIERVSEHVGTFLGLASVRSAGRMIASALLERDTIREEEICRICRWNGLDSEHMHDRLWPTGDARDRLRAIIWP